MSACYQLPIYSGRLLSSESILEAVGAAISSQLHDAELLKGQACFLPLSPDGTPVIGRVPGTSSSLYVASGEPPACTCCYADLRYVHIVEPLQTSSVALQRTFFAVPVIQAGQSSPRWQYLSQDPVPCHKPDLYGGLTSIHEHVNKTRL